MTTPPTRLPPFQPLQGTTVLALEHAVAAPLATRHLADLGADVIKVERPDTGDFARGYDQAVHGQASFFVWLNRGKRSLALDLKASPDILQKLLARADIVVQNLAPGAAARLGLDWGTLHAAHPRLILCDISGYGDTGPYAGRKAYDLLIQAEAGLMGVTGSPDQPSRVGISAADIATGMYAFSGCLAALVQRGRTGRGTHVDVAMLDALAEWMGSPYNHALYGAGSPARSPASHPKIAPYGVFTLSDGAILIGIQNEREWLQFCTHVLHQPGLATDPRFSSNVARVAHREALDTTIAAALAPLDVQTAQALLEQAGIASAQVRDAKQAAEHPQLQARNRWQPVMTEAGEVRALAAPWTMDGQTLPLKPVPALGQHTDEILAELSCPRAC
jgi:crotonobetainyl-CoA:carnitine CoA-transferase CaiB-like acyl-CoA transferase